MTKTNFFTTIANIIRYLLANFDDKHAKQDAKFKTIIEETITDQDASFDVKLKKKH